MISLEYPKPQTQLVVNWCLLGTGMVQYRVLAVEKAPKEGSPHRGLKRHLQLWSKRGCNTLDKSNPQL